MDFLWCKHTKSQNLAPDPTLQALSLELFAYSRGIHGKKSPKMLKQLSLTPFVLVAYKSSTPRFTTAPVWRLSSFDKPYTSVAFSCASFVLSRSFKPGIDGVVLHRHQGDVNGSTIGSCHYCPSCPGLVTIHLSPTSGACHTRGLHCLLLARG